MFDSKLYFGCNLWSKVYFSFWFSINLVKKIMEEWFSLTCACYPTYGKPFIWSRPNLLCVKLKFWLLFCVKQIRYLCLSEQVKWSQVCSSSGKSVGRRPKNHIHHPWILNWFVRKWIYWHKCTSCKLFPCFPKAVVRTFHFKKVWTHQDNAHGKLRHVFGIHSVFMCRWMKMESSEVQLNFYEWDYDSFIFHHQYLAIILLCIFESIWIPLHSKKNLEKII